MTDTLFFSKLQFRFANSQDVPVILRFIQELADYEGLGSHVQATEELLQEWLFVRQKAEVLLLEKGKEAIGFALFFHNFSTFTGRAGLYIEDLYIAPDFRGQGLGQAFFHALAKIAKERGLGRMEWWCLNENLSSIAFYEHLDAQAMSEWTVYRLDADHIQAMTETVSPGKEVFSILK